MQLVAPTMTSWVTIGQARVLLVEAMPAMKIPARSSASSAKTTMEMNMDVVVLVSWEGGARTGMMFVGISQLEGMHFGGD